MKARLSRERGAAALYGQVAAHLRDEIRDGHRRIGERLDSEPALTHRFGVSRATVGKALDLLESEGLIRREHGRGTFVAQPRRQRPLPELTSFSEHVQSLGLIPGQRLLTINRAVATDEHELTAGFPRGDPLLVIERVRLADEQAVGVHTTALPEDLAQRTGVEDALQRGTMSLYALLAEHGVALTRAEEYLRAEEAGHHDAELLGVDPGAALMRVRRLSHDDTGRLIEAVDARYIGWFYDYRIELVRRPGRTSSDLLMTEEGSA